MQHIFNQICANLPQNRLKTSVYFALLAIFSTMLTEYIFAHAWSTNLVLSLGTGFVALVTIFIYHYLVFSFLKSTFSKLVLLLSFPFVYFMFLICGFGFATTLLNITLFQVPLINQIYLQMWVFLGDAFIYATFSPKPPLLLISILVILSFICGLKFGNSQPDQD